MAARLITGGAMRSTLPTTTTAVALINVPHKVGPDAWGRCWDLAAAHTDRGFFGLNEILSPGQRGIYRDRARRNGYGWYGLRTGNGVFWDRTRWRRVSATVVPLHARGSSALARRWPGYNAARSATVVVLEDRRTREQVAVICTHWAPQGRKVPAAWGAWARREAKRQVRQLIKEQQSAIRVTWLLGDLNVKSVVRMNLKGFRWLRRYGVDKVGVAVPAGMRFVHGAASTFKAPTDHHHGVRAVASWRPR